MVYLQKLIYYFIGVE